MLTNASTRRDLSGTPCPLSLGARRFVARRIHVLGHEDRVLVQGVDVLPNVVQQQPEAYEDEGLECHGDEFVWRVDTCVHDRNQERAHDDG